MPTKGVELFGSANHPPFWNRFDLENEPDFDIKYEQSQSGLNGVSKVITTKVEAGEHGSETADKDFHIQLRNGNDFVFERKTDINPFTGIVDNDEDFHLENQTAFFKNDCIFNFGFADGFGDGLHYKSYAYSGANQSSWMGTLSPNTKMKDLVLPGAHDAGMNTFHSAYIDGEVLKKINKYILWYNAGAEILRLPTVSFVQTSPGKDYRILTKGDTDYELVISMLSGVAVNQKDSFTNMLKMGVRYFDFRPGKLDGGEYRHAHNFIFGEKFDTFLNEVASFTDNHNNEIVLVVVRSNGIHSKINFIKEHEVKTMADSAFRGKNVEYDFVKGKDFVAKQYGQKTIQSIRNSKKRVIFIFQPQNVLSSYDYKNGTYEGQSGYDNAISIDDSTLVKRTLGKNMSVVLSQNKTHDDQIPPYTALNINSNAVKFIVDHWQNNTMRWINLFYSRNDSGNILHVAKPTFDFAMYNWLTEQNNNLFKNHSSPIILSNDFVDVAMTQRAIALTKIRNGQAS